MHVYNYISFLKTSFKKFFNLKPLKQVLKAKALIKAHQLIKLERYKKIRDQAFLVFLKGLTERL
ncbi:hypothetical protein EC574_08020 [Helicobacter pylori]|uniref:Uncharacterized protein n=1 Tax=Helicobacter pylori TaxID=210 RepID=A0A438ZDC8_HELPX|nr:hypothetical protein EC574_08020 [Helicobacter pylori]